MVLLLQPFPLVVAVFFQPPYTPLHAWFSYHQRHFVSYWWFVGPLFLSYRLSEAFSWCHPWFLEVRMPFWSQALCLPHGVVSGAGCLAQSAVRWSPWDVWRWAQLMLSSVASRRLSGSHSKGRNPWVLACDWKNWLKPWPTFVQTFVDTVLRIRCDSCVPLYIQWFPLKLDVHGYDCNTFHGVVKTLPMMWFWLPSPSESSCCFRGHATVQPCTCQMWHSMFSQTALSVEVTWTSKIFLAAPNGNAGDWTTGGAKALCLMPIEKGFALAEHGWHRSFPRILKHSNYSSLTKGRRWGWSTHCLVVSESEVEIMIYDLQ